MDYTEAYKTAKPMYNGRMERTLVVLKDDDATENPENQVSGGNREPLGKRTLEDQSAEPSKRLALV